MKIHRALLLGLVAGVSAFAVSSCAYDPYYSGASYSSGYGDGYGYGSSNFSTSLFVGTGNSRWGYDPYAGAYYDYTRRAYYDPYLYGYYPVGYRPRYVHGAPHPHGWSRGSSYCPPPSRIRSYNLTNYHDRGQRYQGLGRDWSKNVRIDSSSRNQRDPRASYNERREGDSRSRGSIFGGRGGSPSVTPDRGGSRPDYNRRDSSRGDSGRGGSRPDFSRGNTSVSAPIPAIPSRGNVDRGRGSDSSRSQQEMIERMRSRSYSSQSGGRESFGRSESRGHNPSATQPSRGGSRDSGFQRGGGDRGHSGGGDSGRGRSSGGGRGVRSLGEG